MLVLTQQLVIKNAVEHMQTVKHIHIKNLIPKSFGA